MTQLYIIDLDNTVYNANNGVFARMDQRMNHYIQHYLQVSHQHADQLRKSYWQQYGTTLKGLMLHHGIDQEDFLLHVHDIQADELLHQNPTLDKALAALKGRKVIHTNASREHAERILNYLGIEHHFSYIYDIRFNDYQPKPCQETLSMLMQAEHVEAEACMVIDDMPDNLRMAQALHAKTALIAEQTDHTWDYCSPDLSSLSQLISSQ